MKHLPYMGRTIECEEIDAITIGELVFLVNTTNIIKTKTIKNT